MKIEKEVFIKELDKSITIEVDIELDDVLDFIVTASYKEIDDIIDACDYECEKEDTTLDDVLDYVAYATNEETYRIMGVIKNDNSYHKRTLEDDMKDELLSYAIKKYTLTQLEEKLGTKFDLM